MFKQSQLLPQFPWVELTHKDGFVVDLCEALRFRDARLYHMSDVTEDGTPVMDTPKWFLDFKHVKGQTRTIEITQAQAEEISDHCGAKIETFSDGAFWF